MLMDGPPMDDCCPVCHGEFTLPCRTSCSHWFCGDCILRVWLFGDAMKRCRCPICTFSFSSLTPLQESFDRSQDPEATKIMKDVKRYNRLHVGGFKGFLQKGLELRFLMWMTLQEMMDPDRAIRSLFRARRFAVLAGSFFALFPIDLNPTVRRITMNFFDIGWIVLVVTTYLIGLYRRRRMQRQQLGIEVLLEPSQEEHVHVQ